MKMYLKWLSPFENKIGTYIIAYQIWVHIIDSIIHDCSCYIFSCNSLCPSLLDIQVKFWLTPVLTGVFQVPLMLKERVSWICVLIEYRQRNVNKVFNLKWVVTSLVVLMFFAILNSVEIILIMYYMGIKLSQLFKFIHGMLSVKSFSKRGPCFTWVGFIFWF